MNPVILDRILEISESKTRWERTKKYVSNWKGVAIVAIGLLTAKSAIEQIVMAIR
jgi:hypothetical protein